MSVRIFKSGGIHFWNVGRVGGSFYCKPIPYRTSAAEFILLSIVGFTVVFGSLAIWAIDQGPTKAAAYLQWDVNHQMPQPYQAAGVVR